MAEPVKSKKLTQEQAVAYWRENLVLIAVLLTIWAGVSFGGSIFGAAWLNQFKIGTLPLGFWLAQQGSIFVFVVLVFAYALLMDRLDRKYGLSNSKGGDR